MKINFQDYGIARLQDYIFHWSILHGGFWDIENLDNFDNYLMLRKELKMVRRGAEKVVILSKSSVVCPDVRDPVQRERMRLPKGPSRGEG